ncbi:alpha-L-rhamnosidase C-terminal domain-containing protein [Luteitalea pratensis]|uniref:alpha-L-rhamnosidase-related protein n=1 Tax=Luteitalea pratensis TaxID=1855912 RepID=UPI00139034ED|nr:alpha-L-rhamnosidase C-terminal domain-containing protein [Luteitalea pratensis]
MSCVCVVGWLVTGVGTAAAQFQAPQVFDKAPAALWVFPPGAAGNEFGVFHFRRVFELDARPSTFVVHVSADNRYRLFVNGEPVSSGPQRSDLMHWRYETVDLAPRLRAGRNVLAAVVWNWGDEKPVAQFSRQTAFLLQGNSPREAIVNSGPEWKVLRNEGYTWIPVPGPAIGGYYAAPPGEAIDARRYPWGWEHPDYPQDDWVAAQAGRGARARRTQLRAGNPFGEAGGWQLVPRSIPPMEESPVQFASVRRTEGVQANAGFLQGKSELIVPSRSRAVLLLDQGHLTNAFPVLETSGGAGSTVALVYAEALKDAKGNKGNRNGIEGKTIAGVRDEFRPDGGNRRRFQTLWFRTYRYVQLEITTGEEPLRVHDLHGIFVGYPFELAAQFSSDLAWLADMWAINWRGARLCAWETYFDTPYYEQLQYVGDTRIQALITLYMSNDDRLVRQAIEHFDFSRIPEGITASRYPSDLGQYIPTFSPIWVAMVHDFWMHRDAPDYVRGFLPGTRSVLAWFERQVDDTGLLGPISWWPYVDWAKEWGRGVPPGGSEGHSTVISLQFVYALDRAAELEQALGVPGLADHYRSLARKVRDAVRQRSWDQAKGLFRDTPGGTTYSQQANVMAVLTDAVAAGDQAALMERVLSDTTLTQSTYYFSYYQFEALRKAGLGDRYVEQLVPWRGMLDLGLTTVPETPEPTRSDSHAWSAHPNYGLLATVVGVRPAEPGFKRVRIEPHLGPLQRVEGRVPHPAGTISVTLARTAGGGLRGEVTLPQGLEGVFAWNGKQIAMRPGRQTVSF